jgi:hypothetical protein
VKICRGNPSWHRNTRAAYLKQLLLLSRRRRLVVSRSRILGSIHSTFRTTFKKIQYSEDRLLCGFQRFIVPITPVHCTDLILIGSPYRLPSIDMPDIDMPRLSSIFRFHISICHVLYCQVTHITIRDGTVTPRIQLPSRITPSTQYLSSQIQVLSRDLPDHTR